MNTEDTEQRLRGARETLAQLIDKRAAHEKRTADLSRERAELAYDAHRGDPKARKRLDQIHNEAARRLRRIES